MNRYALLMTGAGGSDSGCDYTLDCNKTYEIFEAKSDREAFNIVKQKCEDSRPERGFDEVVLIKIEKFIVIPFKKWDGDEDDENEQEELKEELASIEVRIRDIRERIKK
mgnify:CR=1 FL=1